MEGTATIASSENGDSLKMKALIDNGSETETSDDVIYC